MLSTGGAVTGGLHSPGLFGYENLNILIPVPWKELCDAVELGLWSRLSKAPTVNRPLCGQTGDTTLSSSRHVCILLWQSSLQAVNPFRRNPDSLVV